MCTQLTLQEEATRTIPRRWFWLPFGGVKLRRRELPATLGNLSPHLRRDIGLRDIADRPTATSWLDSTAFIGRGP